LRVNGLSKHVGFIEVAAPRAFAGGILEKKSLEKEETGIIFHLQLVSSQSAH
jgi:hypothetical protein